MQATRLHLQTHSKMHTQRSTHNWLAKAEEDTYAYTEHPCGCSGVQHMPVKRAHLAAKSANNKQNNSNHCIESPVH